MSQTTVRKANSTTEEGLEYARFIDIASEGGFRKALGKDYYDIICQAYLVRNHDLSYEHVFFAETEGKIVGMASAFYAENHKQMNLAPLRIAPGSRLRRSIGLALFGVFFRMMGSHSEGEYYLQFLAVDDEFRGQGVGTKLIDFTLQQAREAKSVTYAVDVSAKNEGARRLYERFGCSVTSTVPKSRYLPNFVFRMSKDISG